MGGIGFQHTTSCVSGGPRQPLKPGTIHDLQHYSSKCGPVCPVAWGASPVRLASIAHYPTPAAFDFAAAFVVSTPLQWGKRCDERVTVIAPIADHLGVIVVNTETNYAAFLKRPLKSIEQNSYEADNGFRRNECPVRQLETHLGCVQQAYRCTIGDWSYNPHYGQESLYRKPRPRRRSRQPGNPVLNVWDG